MRKLHSCLLAISTLALLGCYECAAGQTTPSPDGQGMLQMAGGDYIAGRLCDSDQPGVLRWQGAAFGGPFDFDVSAVSVVRFPVSVEPSKPKGEYCFELFGGDVLFGSLVGMTAEQLQIDVPPFGRIHVKREYLQSILRWRDGADLVDEWPVAFAEGADLVYVGPNGIKNPELVYEGPNGLKEWEREHPYGAWQQEEGSLTTERAGALLARNFDLPPQATVEFELSWTGKPNFVFALGAGRHDFDQAFRVEVWDDDLVLLRETDDEADMVPLGKISAGSGNCHLLAYLNLEQNRAIVFSSEGTLLGELAVSESEPHPGSCIRLVNRGSKLRLEQLRIMRWDGAPPREVQAERSRLHRSDGSVVYGEIRGFDAATKEFLVENDGDTKRIHADEVGSVVMASSETPAPKGSRATLQHGLRITGAYDTLRDGRMWLNCPAVTEPLAIPVSELRSLVMLDSKKPAPNGEGREGRLMMEKVRLQGHLVADDGSGGSGCLIWQPVASKTAAAFIDGAAARIVYSAPSRPPQYQAPAGYGTEVAQLPNPRNAPPQPAPRADGVLGAIAQALMVNVPNRQGVRRPPTPSAPEATRHSGTFHPTLYLRSGDTIPCEVDRIDQRGVTFQSSIFDATFAAHEKIKAVELENRSLATKIDKSSRDRLLMLPRARKDNPPTHLIRSIYGDYLRARLIELDDEAVTVEVRLETRKLPRRQVASIIWLEEETSGQPADTEKAKDEAPATRVQALRDDGIRLTFSAERFTGTFLEGTSSVLGPCRVELADVDELTIGGAIEQVAVNLPYQRWKLHEAPEPKFAESDGEGGAGVLGTESALVGKPAPDFQLETLEGEPFRLRDYRGKVVVLEFWATWCGACVDTLPQIDRAVDELVDQDVLLVAVNLQENPGAIDALLERLKLKMTVALDRNGTVAEQYAAAAIPQTVIVNRAGDVARVFVGGGRQYEQQLREALQSVLSDSESREESR